MSASLLSNEKECYLCMRRTGLERHHVMEGPNRKLSEKYGLWVYLCHDCHTGREGAQYDPDKSLRLKREAQREFEKIHGHEMWMNEFMKNYL